MTYAARHVSALTLCHCDGVQAKTTASEARARTGAKRKHRAASYQKVRDARKRPIRGLWLRNDRFYARLAITDPQTGKKTVRRVASEDAHTVPQAQAELRKLLTNRETDSLPAYDSNRKTYRCWFFMLSGFHWEPTGTWDKSSQTFTFKGTLGAGDTGTMTATMRFSDEATFVYSLVATDPGGKVNYHMEGKSVRQK